MRGLRDSDEEADEDGDGGEKTLHYSDGSLVERSYLTSKGRRLKRRQKFDGGRFKRVGGLEQRVSRLEGLLLTVPEYPEITVTQESGEWFAHDPETDLTGNGDSRAAAIAQLAEAIAHESGEISFSEEFAEDVEAGRQQVAAGDTTSADDVRSRLGIDD